MAVAGLCAVPSVAQGHRHPRRPQPRRQGAHRRVFADMHPPAQGRDHRVPQRRVVERREPGIAAHRHDRGGMRQRIFRGEVIRRLRVAHDRGKAVGRDVDALDLVGARAQLRQRRRQAVERRVDRVATRIKPKIVARDVPGRAELVRQTVGCKAVADEIGQRLFDRIGLRLEPGKRQFRRQCRGKPAHAAGDVQGRGAGHRIGVARRQHQYRGDAHRAADPGGVETAQPRPGRGRRQQRHLPVLMRQRARGEAACNPRRDVVAEHERGQHLAPGAAGLLADRQHPRQYLHRRLPRHKAQPLAQFDRPSGDAVQQCRGARVGARPAAGIYRRAAAGARRQPLA